MSQPPNTYGMIRLPKISDASGNLTFIESDRHIPFDIQRVYYLYDVPGGESRGGHAHKELQQLMVAISGSFDVVLNNGDKTERFTLNRAYEGLYVPTMIWRTLENFSSGAVCLVLASMPYVESDYYRDFDDFKRALGARRGGTSQN